VGGLVFIYLLFFYSTLGHKEEFIDLIPLRGFYLFIYLFYGKVEIIAIKVKKLTSIKWVWDY
jgi:hypothetical protein